MVLTKRLIFIIGPDCLFNRVFKYFRGSGVGNEGEEC